jgi:TIGR03009 family protein
MSRNLSVRRLICLMLFGALGAPVFSLHAQDSSNIDPGITPRERIDPGITPRERVDRSRLTQPDLRAGAVDANTGSPVDPRIDALLEEWSQRTKEIKKLQGHHIRATRDFTFNTESWAEGQFYVETPDKGRIDMRPYSKKLPYKVAKRIGPNGRSIPMGIQLDSKNDRWICDGKEIKAIDDDNKTYEAVKIPPQQRGANIMDGPLPFLFGMPPDKAKARYQFKLLRETEQAYAIQVRPNWKQDAVDWTQAELLLDRRTCLPREVHLHNAAGTSETVYVFTDLQINKIQIFFWRDPFEPSLYTYKRSVHNTPGAGPAADPLAANRMPSLVGMPYNSVKTVKQTLENRGHTVKLVRGDPATDPKLVYVVEDQQPPKDAPLEERSQIILTLYDKMAPNPPQPQNSINRTGAGDDVSRTVAKPSDP